MNRRIVLFAVAIAAPAMAAPCDSLASLKLTDTTISASHVVAAGTFTPPGPASGRGAQSTFKTLPGFCRVEGVIQPSADSHIEFEVWLPTSGWNGSYMGVGNGGTAGSITYTYAPTSPGLADALIGGFASSSTDTGHRASGTDGQWAIGHPEKLTDYAYRAIHETAIKSQAVIRAFYGRAAKHSYFDSCSNGGREALMEAQRFPGDYDGIIAGAPAAALTRIAAAFMTDVQALETDPASFIPSSKLAAIESAAVTACDALDGLKDGLIGDPTKCHYNPDTLLCQGADSDTCLTRPQVEALKKIYAGVRSSKGEQLYPGYLPGAETGQNGWAGWFTGSGPGKSLQFQFANAGGGVLTPDNYDFRNFNPDHDVKVFDDSGQRLNANNPDLKGFQKRGGKLVIYHGWSDAALSPVGTIDYFENVVAVMGRKNVDSFVRLYMVPGMQHCGSGPGPNSFRIPIETALERWVGNGAAPTSILATRYKTDGNPASGVTRTRPLCPYPQVARYKGSGSIDEASNFACEAPRP